MTSFLLAWSKHETITETLPYSDQLAKACKRELGVLRAVGGQIYNIIIYRYKLCSLSKFCSTSNPITDDPIMLCQVKLLLVVMCLSKIHLR